MFDKIMVGLWYLELLSVHRIFIFEMDPVFVILGQSEILLVDADRLLVLE